jgi:hypothetical protein
VDWLRLAHRAKRLSRDQRFHKVEAHHVIQLSEEYMPLPRHDAVDPAR